MWAPENRRRITADPAAAKYRRFALETYTPARYGMFLFLSPGPVDGAVGGRKSREVAGSIRKGPESTWEPPKWNAAPLGGAAFHAARCAQGIFLWLYRRRQYNRGALESGLIGTDRRATSGPFPDCDSLVHPNFFSLG